MIYRAFLWFIAVLLFSAGLSTTLFSFPLSAHTSADPISLFVGVGLTTTGALIYIHKLRSLPPQAPKPAGDAAPRDRG